VAWRAATRIDAGVEDLVQRIRDGQAQVGYSVARPSRAQGDEEHGFLGSTSKLRSVVSPGLTSKLVATVLVVCPQNHSLGFFGLTLKTDSYRW
jgi:hypothetical protein